MILCQCGCGQEVKLGNKYINRHNRRGKKHSEKTKERMSKAKKGNQYTLGYKHTDKTKRKMSESKKSKNLSEETREKLSESQKGFKNPNFKHGKVFILNEQHKKHKKEECLFGCESQFYVLHHEPKLNYKDIRTWEGRLINLCVSCHLKIHYHSLKLPDNVGIEWTKEDTEKVLKVDNYKNED